MSVLCDSMMTDTDWTIGEVLEEFEKVLRNQPYYVQLPKWLDHYIRMLYQINEEFPLFIHIFYTTPTCYYFNLYMYVRDQFYLYRANLKVSREGFHL